MTQSQRPFIHRAERVRELNQRSTVTGWLAKRFNALLRVLGLGAGITAGFGFVFLWVCSALASLGVPVVVLWAILHFAFKYW